MADADSKVPDPIDVARFWSHVETGKLGRCWPWRGSRGNYGKVKWCGVPQQAHRIAYLLTFGLPEDAIVRHKCDNPSCCNPTHLETGTHRDNVRDRVLRKRSAIGEEAGRAKLTEAQVLAIEAEEGSHYVLAAKYGVSRDNIRAIKKHRSWKHLWCREPDSNRRPDAYEATALPTELSRPLERTETAPKPLIPLGIPLITNQSGQPLYRETTGQGGSESA